MIYHYLEFKVESSSHYRVINYAEILHYHYSGYATWAIESFGQTKDSNVLWSKVIKLYSIIVVVKLSTFGEINAKFPIFIACWEDNIVFKKAL